MAPELEAMIAAVRAEEKAQAAHIRLDRMNGSIERLGTEVSKARSEIGTKVDGVLLHLAQTTGFEQAKKQTIVTHHFWLNLMVAIVSALGAVLGVKFL